MINDSHIKNFIVKECREIRSPVDSSYNYKFENLGELTDVFLMFLKNPSKNIKLKNTGTKISQGLYAISKSDLKSDELFTALESLSTGFESYLKCLAELKYGESSVEFIGDGVSYVGFLNSALGKLLEGEVAKKNPRDNSIPKMPRQIVPFDYNGSSFEDQVFNYVRDIRNHVHFSPDRRIDEILFSCRLCLCAYLLALKFNIRDIRKKIDPVFVYLEKIKENSFALSKYFVEINTTGSKSTQRKISPPTLEVLKWVEELKSEHNGRGEVSDEELTISDLLTEDKSIWLIGEPGSGKTTSLLNNSLERAKTITNLGLIKDKLIPVFVPAKLITESNNLEKLLIDRIKISKERLDQLLIQGKIWLMIDGINEISSELQIALQKDVELLFQEYDRFPICVSSRRYGFSKTLPLEVFELVPMSWGKIQEYIVAYVDDEKKQTHIYDQIREGNDLVHDFAKNPLLLTMLIKIGIDQDIPSNFGLILKSFINWIYSREEKITAQTNRSLKDALLAELAFQMKLEEKRSFGIDDAVNILESQVKLGHEKVGAHSFIEEVMKNGILIEDTENTVSFFHELVLEYYAAVKLKKSFKHNKKSITSFYKNPDWYESLIVFSGLLENSRVLINQLAYHNIVLAARCIGSGSQAPESSIKKIIKSCSEGIELNKEIKENSFTALLELSQPSAFRLFIKSSARIDYKTFNRVIRKCQRPDITALKLLEFGLTGKFRIRQCLKIITGKDWNLGQLRNDVMHKAQESLLASPVEIGDLKLISGIGIHPNLKDRVEQSLVDFLTKSKGFNKQYFNILETACDLELMDNKSRLIKRVLPDPNTLKTGDQFYLLFRALVLIKNEVTKEDLESYLDQIIGLRFYHLAAKFLLEFKNQVGESDQLLRQTIEAIKRANKIRLLVQLKSEFPLLIDNDDLQNVFIRIAQTTRNDYIFSFTKEFRELLGDEEIELVRQNLINNNWNLRANTVIKWIKAIECEHLFEGLMSVTTYHPNYEYGFARILDSGQVVYFNNRNKTIDSSIRKGDILKVITVAEPIHEIVNDRAKSTKARVTNFALPH